MKQPTIFRLRSLVLTSLIVPGLLIAGPSRDEEIMKKNAEEQGAVLNQKVADDVAKMVADRDKLHAKQAAESNAGQPGVRTKHPDAQWFGKSPIGLFIHWGIASVHGETDLSWSMVANMGAGKKITPAEYWGLAKGFTAGNYNPDRWLSVAKANGFSYAVLTVKHHDGFTLWPTQTTKLGVQTTLPGRDLVKEFVEACRRNGLKVGLFYSGPDWHYDQAYRSFNYRSESGHGSSLLSPIAGRPDFDIHHKPTKIPPMPPEFKKAYREYARTQIKELLTRYGKIDVMWFDGGSGSDMTVEEIRALQPGIVINNRGTLLDSNGQNFEGDFFTWESGAPKERPTGWWEQQRIWNSPYWGYTKRNESGYAPVPFILSLLARTVSWGGSSLINVGPRPDGTLPDPYYKGMEEISAWMMANRASLIGSGPVPVDAESNVPVTTRPGVWFLHNVAGRQGPITLTFGSQALKPVSARILGTESDIPFEWDGKTLKIDLPAPDKKAPHNVVAVTYSK